MRQALCCGVVLCGVAVQGAVAQQATSSQMSVGVSQSVVAAILEPVTNAQYQADKVFRSVQTLSDGTVITHETRGLIARDAQGRTREDIYMVTSGQVSGRQMNKSLQSVTVGDPVAHTMLFWTGDKTKIAMQMQMPSLPKMPKLPDDILRRALTSSPPPPPPGGVTGNQQSQIKPIFEEAPPPGMVSFAGNRQTDINMPNFGDPNSPLVPANGRQPDSVTLGTALGNAAGTPKDEVRTEELGQQSIEGLLVTGRRVTTTIPAGKLGNDRPIVVVHEEWRSPELEIVVKTIDTDPRTGVQTMELQGLTRTDPDPALFQAPPGYQVKDMADTLKGLGDLGKPKAQ
jgi:hypothetical protein